MTGVTADDVRRAMDGLVFLGTQPTVARLADRLARHGRGLESCLVLDACYDPADVAVDDVTDTLAAALPADCRPCLTVIPTMPGVLAGRGLALQAVSAADTVETESGQRFPDVATAGPLVAVSGQRTDTSDDMVAQTVEVMERVAHLLSGHGAGWDDAVRFDVFYRAGGTKDDWAVNARERARFFTEPGPATTGIPVGELPGRARILLRTLAVRGARDLGLREHSWPEGHWDWPFHLPYKHGCGCAGMVFVGGQVSLTSTADVVDPGRLDLQAVTSARNVLKVVAELGKTPADVLRLMAFYRHEDASSAAVVEQAIRSVCTEPDVELSLIGLPYLAYSDMVVEIEAEVR